MNNMKYGIAHRFLAAFLAVILVLGMMPATAMSAYAADGVTVTVTDPAGKAIDGATVSYTITYPEGSESSGSAVTGADGVATLPVASYVEGMSLSANVSKEEGYVAKSTGGVIASTAQNFAVVLTPLITDVQITPASGWNYDGTARALVTVVAQSGDTVTYTLNGETVPEAPTATNPGTYSVGVAVARDGYQTLTASFDVVVGEGVIPAKLTPAGKLTYDGTEQTLATVTGYDETIDTVTWTVNGAAVASPVATDAGTYEVKVTVTRNDPNYAVLELTDRVTIARAEIKDVSLTALKNVQYTGQPQAIVELTGTQPGDVVTWMVDGQVVGNEAPKRMAIGEYKVSATIDRGTNYEPKTLDVTAKIDFAVINLDRLKVTGLRHEYDGTEKPAIKVENRSGDYTLQYQLVKDMSEITENGWKTEIPKVTNAGSYIAVVRAVQEFHNDAEVSVVPAEGAATPYNVYVARKPVEKPQAAAENTFVYDGTEKTYALAAGELYTISGNTQINANAEGEVYIAKVSLNDKVNYVWADDTDADLEFSYTIEKARQGVEFKNGYTSGGSESVTIYGSQLFSFFAFKSAFEGNVVKYSFDEGTTPNIATIDSEGQMTVTDGGVVKVIAALEGNDNYHPAMASYTLYVKQGVNETQKLISFPQSEAKAYVFGENDGVVSELSAAKLYANDMTIVAYTIDKSGIGLEIDENGKLSISDYALLGAALTESNGELEVTVTASKAENDYYEKDTASYDVTIRFADMPELDDGSALYTLDGEKGKIGDVETDWYTGDVTVSTSEAIKGLYKISKTTVPADFKDSALFSNQGSGTRYVHLRDVQSGGITAGIPVELSIDNEIGLPTLSYSTAVSESILENITMGFYDAEVTVNIELIDEISGIDHFEYSCVPEEGTNVVGSGVLTADDITYGEGGKATASFEVPPQFRGRVVVKAVDQAGNTAQITGDKVIIVDNVAPGVTVSFDNTNVINGKYYYADRTATIKVTEANFFAEDMVITVDKTLNDGTNTKENMNPVFVKDGDVHTATILFGEDADYIFEIQYTDRSDNKAEPYKAEFTIDKTNPHVEVTFDNEDALNNNYFKAERTATITVAEHNFSASAFVAKVNDAPQELTWTSVGDVHTATIDFPGDDHYSLEWSYKDQAGNEVKSEAPTKFTVDKTAPADLTISYSKPVLEFLLQTVSFGFYQAPVTVTIEAVDPVAGIDYFDYSYEVASEVSDVNKGSTGKITADAITYDDGKATATFEIPAQFRGYVSAVATDRAGNVVKAASEKVIIVDEIAPGIEVIYDNENALNEKYFNAKRTATIVINEANFFAEDLQEEKLLITVTKTLYDGSSTTDKVKPEFTKDGDKYTAKVEFTENADYIFEINYTDRAGNVADPYKTEFTIDMVKPKLSVSYNDTVTPENDTYYKADRKVIFTIEEHNFRAREVEFSIEAKDVTGAPVDLSAKGYGDYLKNQRNWTRSGDIWTASITLDIEGNYEIGMTYEDLAGDEQENAISDAFCIDKSVPTGLTASYSESVLSNLIDAITFGFYQGPVTVTIKALDDVAGVDYFTYSYAVADGASSVNEGKSNVVIPTDKIDYKGNEATATFKIPAQYRGQVSFTATDKAGNSESITAAELLVVDDIAPEITVTYDNNEAKYNTYYGAKRTATIAITEANFFAEDVVITVDETLNDGTHTNTRVQPAFTSNGDVHTATVEFSKDADYIFTITYTDRSGNEATRYEEEFTIDTIQPVIDVTYDNDDARNEKYFKADRTATIVITEHNFNAADVAAVVAAKVTADVEEVAKEVTKYTDYLKTAKNWTREGDVHTATIKYTDEAHYTFDIAYTDMAGHKNSGVNYGNSAAPTEFTLDKSAPTELDITAQVVLEPGETVKPQDEEKFKETTVLDTDNSVAFDTFYARKIMLKLYANCDISGMESFQYQKVNAVSEYEETNAWTPYDEAAGIVVAPSEKLVIYFKATDNAGNETIVNSTGIVVDDKEPTGEQNAPDIVIKATTEPNENGLYKGDVTFDLQVVEPKYTGSASDAAAGFYSGLKKINYRIYTEDTKEEKTDVLFQIPDDKGANGITDGGEYDNDRLVNKWTGSITIDSTKFNSNNVVVQVVAEDNAGNIRTTTLEGIQIDVTSPEINISYNNNAADSGKYYKADRIATIEITERNFSAEAENLSIKITNDHGVTEELPNGLIPAIPEVGDWKLVEGTDSGNGDGKKYRATIAYTADGDYHFEITYTDKAGNESNPVQYGDSTNPTDFTIDKTLPIVHVSYNNNAAENGKYFKANRTATITVNEHNFDEKRVTITTTANRGGVNPLISIWHSNGDIHTATVAYTADGDYTFDVTMTDMAGNASAPAGYGNTVAGKDFIIDTTYEDMITIGGVENGKAYGYDATVIPTVNIHDINLDTYTVTLTGIQKDTTIDLTDKVNALLSVGAETVEGSFDIFDVVQDLDGIYTMKVTSLDKAGNRDEEQVTFTVNRFGSVYVYGQYLLSLIANGGAYVQKVTEDLIITEYNADKLVSDSLAIEITCDGKPLENVIFTVTPEINDAVATGESGWYQYKYTISKDNFTSDGIYKISVSTKDATGNAPENNRYEDMGITFHVDSTLPEISSIVGLEEAIINATEQAVSYTVYDTMGLKSIKVYVNGTVVDEITDFTSDMNNFSGGFTLNEQTSGQTVQIVVEDLAGNITDTDAETFISAYEFNRIVTVSTNVFVRWYANKPLFWGSIGGTTAVAAGLWIFLATKRKKSGATA